MPDDSHAKDLDEQIRRLDAWIGVVEDDPLYCLYLKERRDALVEQRAKVE